MYLWKLQPSRVIIVHISIFAIYLQFVKCAINNSSGSPEVSTALGNIQGVWKTSFHGRQYASFEGIPYAKPPVDELRFEEPQPVEAWTGIWQATKLYECPQVTFDLKGEPTGQEDCLYINVYVPKTTRTTKLDVVVHIHGGCNRSGSGHAYVDPKYVMDRDLILVTFNFRLGVLGFLSTEDETLPGNNGLKDQVLALKWVQKCIATFGGNPESVTLTGFSSGGSAVHFHYLSPMSKGLFHRGMSMSGSVLNPWALTKNSLKKTNILARVVGCQNDDLKELVRCLKTKPTNLLVKQSKEHLHYFSPSPLCPLTPVVEKHSKNPFLPDHPYKLLKKGKLQDLPWLASATADDGLVFSLITDHQVEEINLRWPEVAPYLLDFEETLPESCHTEIINSIRRFYLPNGAYTRENFKQITKMFTDREILVDVETAVEIQSNVTKSPVYFYRFTYEGVNSFKHLLTTKNVEGTSHGDDMIYFFGGLISKPLSKRDIQLQNTCLDILYSYAHRGVPSYKNVKWTSVDKDFVFYNITGPDDIKMQRKTDYSYNKFWKELGLLENGNLFLNKDEL